jgi:hypothetical protein
MLKAFIIVLLGLVLMPSEKRLEAARGALRPIEAEHAARSLSKKCRFPRLESGQMEVHRGAS